MAYNSNDLTDKPAEKRKSHKIMKPIVGSSTKQVSLYCVETHYALDCLVNQDFFVLLNKNLFF